ncbi:MAG: alpha-glucuronidase [Bacteroidota bacterium]|nr:alpha-glucuronidase [Bacteroidota bacterium]
MKLITLCKYLLSGGGQIRSCQSILFLLLILTTVAKRTNAENGHSLWLRKGKTISVMVTCRSSSAMVQLASAELRENWCGKFGENITVALKPDKAIKGDGFILTPHSIQAATPAGVLYGVFDFLRRQKCRQDASITSNPSYGRRVLDHWDNLNGTIERGYAGKSIFWRDERDSLTATDQDRKLWREYARANASIGINGAVLNNVNAAPFILSGRYLKKIKEIADVLRLYGVRTYLSVNFASPIALGKLKTADPLDPEVIKWWQNKIHDIYTVIPDFGGFLVKANSEGQSGPQDYHRTHADGANMFADALRPYGGIVMWRAFVYSASDNDRAKQAYAEFMPFDGQFRDNVIIQVKNGPVDFQPREPFSPLFGVMKKTSVMPEFEITKEYLGENIHLVFLATLWEELLNSDTYQAGKGSTVARCTDGSIYPQKYTAIAGVANIGLDSNWCGSDFDQANWYAFGRLAWNDHLSSALIADEWLKLTFSSDSLMAAQLSADSNWENNFLAPVKGMMLKSRQVMVNYMMPLGLHHIFSANQHYGPGPWYAPKNVRVDWTPPYYHRADATGIGFGRTRSGSDAVDQYHQPLADEFNGIKTCPDKYLLWFHHVPWTYKMASGRTLWDELCFHYQDGLQAVRNFQKLWDTMSGYVDEQRFNDVQSKLRKQCHDAQVYKDGCLLYFQTFSKMAFPTGYERPVYDLSYLESIDPLTMEKLPFSNRR